LDTVHGLTSHDEHAVVQSSPQLRSDTPLVGFDEMNRLLGNGTARQRPRSQLSQFKKKSTKMELRKQIRVQELTGKNASTAVLRTRKQQHLEPADEHG
jgi:hypothetical protein